MRNSDAAQATPPTGAAAILNLPGTSSSVGPIALLPGIAATGLIDAPIDMDTGVLFFFAVGAATELSVFMAGWSSRNKYSLLGAMRAIAQMISYEVPLIISTITVVMMVGSLSTVKIVEAQADYFGQLPHWHVFTPWGFAGFILFLIAAMAESNRSPFDLPEGESEIVAGYFIEYSGFKFALFFLAEYLGMFAVSGLAITLFLGGWTAPLAFHLGARHGAAAAHGPIDELRLEIHAADGPHQYRRRGSVAFFARGFRPLGGLLGDADRSVCPAGQGIDGRETFHKTNIPVCGVSPSLNR